MNNPLTTPQSGKKSRNSNLELFRIITMFLIVLHHYVVNSGLTDAGGVIYSSPLSWRSMFLLLIGAWGKIGINCFLMITGYFMCKSNITTRKFLKLYGEVVFYRVLFFLIFLLTGYQPFSVKEFLLLFIPINSIRNGFTGCYMVFFLFIPFLNILLKQLNEKQHLLLLALCGFTYVVFGTLHRVTLNYVSWFMVVYLIAAYLRIYPKKVFSDKKVWGILTAIFVILSATSVICCAILGMRIHKEMAFFFVTDSNTFLAVGTGVCAFLLFKNLSLKNNKVINTIAASTFGVLCIHANNDAMRRWLWIDLLDNVGHYNSSIMPLYVIGSCLLIFMACTLIDIIRIQLVEKPFFHLIDRYVDKAEETVKNQLNTMMGKFISESPKD